MSQFTATPLVEAVLALVTGPEHVTREHIERIAGNGRPPNENQALADSLEGVRMSGPRVLYSREDAVNRATVSRVVTEREVAADLYVTQDSDGTLGGFRMVTPIPQIDGVQELRAALRHLDAEASVVADTQEVHEPDTRVKAISSLVKVFVLLAVLRAVEAGTLGLEDGHVLTPDDISHLSAGIVERHAGKRLTVAELCRLMILRSDNTAMDVLLGMVGTETVLLVMAECGADPGLNVPLRSTRRLTEISWGEKRGRRSAPAATTPAQHWENLVDLAQVHQHGLDYFAPLSAVAAAMREVAAKSWSPWPPAPSGSDAAPLLYKGGAAPGVLSAVWSRRVGDATRSLLFAVNSETPMGYIEEVYAYTCAERMLRVLRLVEK